MGNRIKIALASLLVAMLLALGGLSMVVSVLGGGLKSASNGSLVAQAARAARTVYTNNSMIATGSSSPATQGQGPSGVQAGGVIDARATAKRVGPAVVTVINNLQSQDSSGLGTISGIGPQAVGSGLIIDRQGYIVTNAHVVQNQASLEVVFADSKHAAATLVGTDQFSDVAVIKVNVAVPAVAQFGDSSTLQPGQPVVAIGSALGDYANTVTEGIISGLHRTINDTGAGGGTASTSLRDLVQTDAAINHGNSGGPLIDLASGQVIGINTAVVRAIGSSSTSDIAEGLGFAIPSNTVKSVVDGLIKNGSIQRPYLGIEYASITPQVVTHYRLTRQDGAYVTNVAVGSPADRAGIQLDSIITKLDGTSIDANNTLVDLLMKHKVGDSVKLTVVTPNSRAENDLMLVLTTRPSNQ